MSIINNIKNKRSKKITKNIFNMVRIDISIIESFLEENPNYPIIMPSKSNQLYKEFKNLKKNYQEKYCPFLSFNLFTESEKIQYIPFRVIIDNNLGIKNTKYRI